MARGLNLQIASQDGTKWLDAYLPANLTINITHNSQIWNAKAGSFSETISLPIEENLHILGNLASMHGCDVYKLLYGRRFRLFGEGILIFYGVIHLDEEVSIKSNTVDIELAAANLEWDDLIADLDCRDIPLTYDDIDEITLGKTVSSSEIAVSMSYRSREWEAGYDEDGHWSPSHGPSYECAGQEPVDKIKIPDLVIPDNFVNYNDPYPTKKFCNINICWQKEDSEGNKLREYEVASSVRENSSPCFYVMYFLECLFKHLGIAVKKNDMLSVQDICRLAFINTACYYEIGAELPDSYKFDLHDYFEFSYKYKSGYGLEKRVYPEYPEDPGSITFHDGDEFVKLEDIKFDFGDNDTKPYRAIATPKNFPDKDVKSVVSAIMDGFGGRLIYNSVDKAAQIVLLRNILRQTDYTEIPCKIISVYQQQNSKAGFRMRYSATTVDKEEDYDDKERDTMYNYTEYNEVIETRYQDIYKNPRIYDNNTYIDPVTGNTFRVKVDKDAKDKKTLYPSWFEVAQFCRVEYGDCSNEDNVEEVVVDFTPVTMNVVKILPARAKTQNNPAIPPMETFAYFVDVTVEKGKKEIPEEVYFDYLWTGHDLKNRGRVDVFDSSYHFAFSLTLVANMQCAYNPSEVAGNPMNDIDNGLTLGFCRGIASNYDIEDGYGNLIYHLATNNTGAFHSDTMDNFANKFAGGSSTEPVSLKLQSEKPFYEPSGEGGGSGTVTVSTREQAASLITSLFPDSNVNLLNRPSVSSAALRAKGWEIKDGQEIKVYSHPFGYYGSAANICKCLLTPITSSGSILSLEELRQYFAMISFGHPTKAGIKATDAANSGLLIDVDSSKDRQDILYALASVYYTPAGESITPIVIDTGMASHVVHTPSQPKRGLYDRFYTEYARWITEGRVAVIEAEVELAWMVNIDITKKYKIGDYLGFLKDYKYPYSNDGLGKVTFELLYLAE